LRRGPGLSRTPDVPPEFVIRFVIAPADIVVARRFDRDALRHLDSCLLDPLRHGLATAEKQGTNQKITRKQKVKNTLHFSGRHLYRSFTPYANYQKISGDQA